MVFIIYLCINKCILQITHAMLHEDWRCGRAAADFFKRIILKRRNALARRKKTNPAALVAFMKTPVYLRSGGDERERQTASLNVQRTQFQTIANAMTLIRILSCHIIFDSLFHG